VGIAKNKFDGREFEFERSALLKDRVIVDFDPGPDLQIGIYSTEEFELTFDVVKE
jgi:hypothetical protein